jgi:hypothetical protein
MTVEWVVGGASVLFAVLAWMKARRAARRLEQLTQLYWELKYQHGELRVQVQRLTGETTSSSVAPPPGQRTEAFVPLTSLKR